ncbi:MAG: hypothetical protein ACXVRS_09670 [Gaiellaceae bacterium]
MTRRLGHTVECGVCDAGAMTRGAVSALVVVAIAGCGGSRKSTLMTGCTGLPTARQSMSFLALFGATNRLSQRFVCAHFGQPHEIARRRDGSVSWTYGSATITFRGSRVVGGTETSGNTGSELQQTVQLTLKSR